MWSTCEAADIRRDELTCSCHCFWIGPCRCVPDAKYVLPANCIELVLKNTPAKKDRILAFLKSIETGDPGPIAVVNEEKYIQHNPQTEEGSEGLAVLFQRLSKTSPRVNIVRAFEDGDFVFAHTEYDFSRRNIGFEVFRFEDGRAVEHGTTFSHGLGPIKRVAVWWTGRPKPLILN